MGPPQAQLKVWVVCDLREGNKWLSGWNFYDLSSLDRMHPMAVELRLEQDAVQERKLAVKGKASGL